MAEPPTFETARLLLRPFTAEDADGLAAIFADREAWWDVLSIPGMPHAPGAVAERRIADSIAGWRDHGAGFWAICARDPALGTPGRIVGYCGFVNPAKSEAGDAEEEGPGRILEVGWGIDPSLQRRGLAREAMVPVLDYAFRELGCARLVAITHPENRASRALIERLGFAFDEAIRAYGEPQVRYVLDRPAGPGA